MVRVRFAGVEFRRDHVVLGFWLKRRIESPRLVHQHVGRRDHVYKLRVWRPEEVDDEVRAWLSEAYVIGRQER